MLLCILVSHKEDNARFND